MGKARGDRNGHDSAAQRINARLAELGRKRGECDAELLRSAATKRAAGQRLNRSEAAQLRRYEEIADEERFFDYCRRIPQRVWRVLCNKQTKQLNDQATRYGLPLGGSFVDLAELVPAIFAFLADNSRRLAAPDSDDPLLAGVASPALERYRDERARIAKFERLQLEQTLYPRAMVYDALSDMAQLLRSTGDTLQRQYGADALAIVDEAMEEFVKRMIDQFKLDDEIGNLLDG